MAPERKVPVQKSDNNLIDQEFSSIRTRFEDEMKKMEEEMNKFRTQLMDRERTFFGSDLSSSNNSTRSTFGRELESSAKPATKTTHWLDDLNSPLVQDSPDGNKVLKLRFDVTQYAPEEIVVKTIDNRLQVSVHAKHEEKSENKSVYREYNREFLLPKGTNPELIRSSLSKDGVLTVESPLPALEYHDGEKRIPIQHK
ncbi:Heat Shock Protein 20-like protein [Euroglyphus maynei]|uniref:Heat Shock Protein 20-like protein n=1 Tax=Euroglyphus maynei TaxID=6958 RepID=A0A1Y3B9N2_EURMA|nr:Heat Shock Protein 20-like protein [Euroglyphus maynei]